MQENSSYKLKKMTALAVFAAMAFVVHYVHIPVMFLNFDFKDVIMTVAGMYFGPLSGAVLAIVVPILEFLLASDTGVYGLIMNVFSSMSFVVTASLVYRFRRTLSGAIIALVSAVLAMTAVMLTANLLITPYYMGVSVADVGALIPKLLLPFNFTKAVLNASLTLCLYKPLTTVLRRTGFGKPKSENTYAPAAFNKKHSLLIWIIAGAVAIASLCVIFFVLGGYWAFL